MEMQELSLVISNPEDGQFLQHITWNRDEFMALVSAIADEYRGLTYTDEQIGIAKEDRAKLNKAKKAISDKRIEVKKAITAPYDRFEAEIKEGVAKIDEVVSMIDGQIKEYEDGVREKKRAGIQMAFNASIRDVDLPMEPEALFRSLFDEKWLNMTVSLKKANAEMEGRVKKIKTDLDTISRMDVEYVEYARDVYARTRDISAAMNEVARIQESRRRAEEERQRREAQEREREEREKAAVTAPPQEQDTQPDEDTATSSVPERIEPEDEDTQEDTAEEANVAYEASTQSQQIYRASFTVHGTIDQINRLKTYMNDNGIRFERVVK